MSLQNIGFWAKKLSNFKVDTITTLPGQVIAFCHGYGRCYLCVNVGIHTLLHTLLNMFTHSRETDCTLHTCTALCDS